MLRMIDLFSGCGGMTLGFINAGYSAISSYECWDAAIQCHKKNFKHPIINADLSEVDKAVECINNLDSEIIIGGPPCQDFSPAGKRVESDRAILTNCFAEIICKISPSYFVMENVSRSLKSNAYATARNLFRKAGYGLTETILDASLCGVPQRRKRFICIGHMDAEDGFMTDILNKNLSESNMTVREYFGNDLDIEYYYRHPRTYSRRGIFSIDEPAPTIRGVNRPIPGNYVVHKGDATSDLSKVRALSTGERARIQTFPECFKWIGSKAVCEQMIGNAVPVKLAEFIANSVLEYASL